MTLAHVSCLILLEIPALVSTPSFRAFGQVAKHRTGMTKPAMGM